MISKLLIRNDLEKKTTARRNQEFASKDWVKPRRTSLRIAGVQTETLTRHLMNSTVECYSSPARSVRHGWALAHTADSAFKAVPLLQTRMRRSSNSWSVNITFQLCRGVRVNTTLRTQMECTGAWAWLHLSFWILYESDSKGDRTF
jgi:hypothetical protein